MGKIDGTDMKILAELMKEASLSVPKLSKKININSSVVYSRIKRMVKRGLIKRFTVEVDEELLGYDITASVGLDIDATLRETIVDKVTSFKEVRRLSEVTGRFDLFVEIKARSLNELHQFVAQKIGRVDGVRHTETFIELKRQILTPQLSLPK